MGVNIHRMGSVHVTICFVCVIRIAYLCVTLFPATVLMVHTGVHDVSFLIYDSHLFFKLHDTSFGFFDVGSGCFILGEQNNQKNIKNWIWNEF